MDDEVPADWRLPANMVLSLFENVISITRGTDDGHGACHGRVRAGGVADRQTAGRRRPQVVVADLDTPANRKKAEALPDGVAVRWADLTDPAAVDRLVSEVSPSAIVHLAAVIPPPLYRNPGLARKVNVDATVALVRAAEAQPEPPRFVQASSNAVYGSRNPHRVTDVVRADTPPRPFELYSNTKFEAEEFVRASSLDWVVLRLGGVLSPNFSALPLTRRRHLHRKRAAHRRAHSHRRRPRCRRRVRGGHHRRRRAARSC